MKRNLLLTPGPTKLPQEVCEALGRPIIHHRTPQFQEDLKKAIDGLKYVLQTKNDVFLLASSGTGAMEASVCNILSPGDKVITVEGGKFGERWSEICQAYGIQTEVIKVKWGRAVTAQEIKKILDANKDIKAVFITHCETSTGVTTDIEPIGKVIKATNAVLVVDAVSSLGVTDLKTDAWGVDVVASASHKGLMLPPGLAFVSVSPKAFSLIEKSKCPKYYFDWKAAKNALAKTDTPFTPAIGIVIALNESLALIKKTGLENVFANFEKLARATREAVKALGLTLYPHESCISNVLTAVNVPNGVDGKKLVKIMRDTHGISIAGGQAELEGKIFRIAHMGCVNKEDISVGISHLAKVLNELGYQFDSQAGLTAAQEALNTV